MFPFWFFAITVVTVWEVFPSPHQGDTWRTHRPLSLKCRCPPELLPAPLKSRSSSFPNFLHSHQVTASLRAKHLVHGRHLTRTLGHAISVLHTWPFPHMGLQPCDICFWYSFPFNSFLKNREGCKQALAIGIEGSTAGVAAGPWDGQCGGAAQLGSWELVCFKDHTAGSEKRCFGCLSKMDFFILFKFYYVSAWSLDYGSVLSSSFLSLEAPSLQAGGPCNASWLPTLAKKDWYLFSRTALWLWLFDYDWEHLLLPSPVY